MLSGTPLGAILDEVGKLYWVVLFFALLVAVVRGESLRSRLVGVTWVLGILVGPLLLYVVPAAVDRNRALARYNASAALFAERCKSAGEKIHKTVDNVEGVVWMKWRLGSANQYDQYKLDDPFGHDCSGEGCILQLLRITKRAELSPEDVARHRGRYAFVESVDPVDGKIYRYVGTVKPAANWTEESIREYEARTGKSVGAHSYMLALDKTPIDRFTARYGITWDDLSTREDREHWIAGGSLKILDLQTNEVIAERTGYMMDAAQGNTSGARQPWSYAPDNACPAFPRAAGGGAFHGYRSQNFEMRVLKPAL